MPPRRHPRRWGLWLLLACVVCRGGRRDDMALPLRAKVLALFDDGRPTAARIAGQREYHGCTISDSAGLVPSVICERARSDSLSARGASAAAEITSVLARTSSVDASWSLGLLDLWSATSDPRAIERSIGRLSEVVARDPSTAGAGALNDLAVAHLARASLRDDPRDVFTALEYAEQALARDSASEIVKFNVAFSLETAGLELQALDAWKALADSSSPWGREAWTRYHALDSRIAAARLPANTASGEALRADAMVERDPQRAREYVLDSLAPRWADLVRGNRPGAAGVAADAERIGRALAGRSNDSSMIHVAGELRMQPPLARALTLAAAGAADYGQTRYVDARPKLEQASVQLRRANAVSLADWSDLFIGGLAAQRGDYPSAEKTLTGIGVRARARHDVALEARANWGLAFSRARRGAMSAVEPPYRIAAGDFERLGESPNYAYMQALIADIHAALGQSELAARDGYLALRTYQRRSDAGQRYAVLLALGHRLSEEGKNRAATAAVREATIEAEHTGRAKDIPESLARLADAEAQVGEIAAAARAAVAARTALASVGDSLMHARIEMEVARAEARVHSGDTRFAIGRLDDVLTYFRQTAIKNDQARTLVERSALELASGDSTNAERDLGEATDLVHGFLTSSASAELTRQVAATQRAAYHALIEIALARGDTTAAYAYSKRARPHAIRVEAIEKPSASEPPNENATLEYVVLGDKTLIWASTGSQRRLVTSSIGERELGQWATRFVNLIRQGDDSLAEREIASRLDRALLAPVRAILDNAHVHRIEIVPDGSVDEVPFAALRDSSGNFAARRYAFSYGAAPRELPNANGRAGETRALVVGDPSWDRTRFPELGELRATTGEVKAVRVLYPSATVLAGNGASRSALLRELARHDLMHFAGHARVVGDHPGASHLVLARDTSSFAANVLYASEIAKLDLRRLHLVVLSSCGESRSPFESGHGNGLVQAFLDAGTTAVVASGWEANDDATAALTRHFHEALRAGVPADEALQKAQLALMDGDAASMAPRRMWAGFRYYVGGEK